MMLFLEKGLDDEVWCTETNKMNVRWNWLVSRSSSVALIVAVASIPVRAAIDAARRLHNHPAPFQIQIYVRTSKTITTYETLH